MVVTRPCEVCFVQRSPRALFFCSARCRAEARKRLYTPPAIVPTHKERIAQKALAAECRVFEPRFRAWELEVARPVSLPPSRIGA